MNRYVRALSAASLVLGASGAAWGQLSDTRIPLNYNFHGMAHSAALNGGVDEWTATANNANADLPNSYRSIADRGLVFDPSNNHSLAFYSGQQIGKTGISYAFYDTLGYANTTATDPATGGLDIVHLGSRCAGFAPATIFAYEATADGVTTVGVAPNWNICDQSNNVPQVTSFSPVTLDGGAEIGVLYHASSGGGQFDVVLGFTDHAPVTVRVSAPDWFGVPADPAVIANNPVSSQKKISHVVGTTTYNSFQGVQNNDAPVIAAFVTGGGGPNLNVIEAVISIPQIVSGVGTFPADATIVGAHLNSITFQNAAYPTSGGRGFAIFAATVRTGQPTNADCTTPTIVSAGDTATNNNHTFGATPTLCGGNDTSAVYYQYTAANTGTIQVRTCGASIDTTLAAYSTCGGPALACNDDACGAASIIEFPAVAGQAYLIRVAGKAGATGSFTLHVEDPAHTDTQIPLNYNFHGMAHSAAITGGSDEFTAAAVNANADLPNGYRSIADRGMLFDPSNNHSLAFYSGAKIGTNALSYRFFNTLGYANTTGADPATNGLDIVHLGSRCTGFAPATSNAYEAAVNAATNVGIAPVWSVCDHTNASPQTTNFSPLTLTATSQVGVLYHGSNSGGQFDVVLGFSDHPPVTVRVAAPDWFGVPADPAVVANNPVSSQKKLAHTVGTTSYGSFQGCQNNDAPTVGTFSTTGAGPNLNVVEAVISVPLIVSGVGTFPADPTIVGAHLNSVTFQNATYPTTGGRGYAIFAMTVRDATVPATGVCCRGSTCSTTVSQAACVPGGTAGARFVSASSVCNAGSNTAPCCYADYNKANGLGVQDIFDFLGDWFAGSPYARFGGDGSAGALTVQNIFDFLAAWFAGGC